MIYPDRLVTTFEKDEYIYWKLNGFVVIVTFMEALPLQLHFTFEAEYLYCWPAHSALSWTPEDNDLE